MCSILKSTKLVVCFWAYLDANLEGKEQNNVIPKEVEIPLEFQMRLIRNLCQRFIIVAVTSVIIVVAVVVTTVGSSITLAIIIIIIINYYYF
jgi:hypothetical protein